VTVDQVYPGVGDDTTSGLTVSGTLKFSRLANSGLTVRGQIALAAGGRIDLGTEVDPISAAVAAHIEFNDSAVMGVNKYGMTTATTAAGFSAWGAAKTQKTLVTAVLDSTNYTVLDASGWAVGDVVFLGPTTAAVATREVRKITAISFISGAIANITLSAAATNTTVVGRRLFNVTRNVRIFGKTQQTYGTQFQIGTNSALLPDNFLELGPCEFVGAGGAATAASSHGVAIALAKTAQVKKVDGPVFHSVVSVSGSTVTGCSVPAAASSFCLLGVVGAPQMQATLSNVLACSSTGFCGIGFSNSAAAIFDRPTVVGTTTPVRSSVSVSLPPFEPTLTNVDFCGMSELAGGFMFGLRITSGTVDAIGRLGFTGAAGSLSCPSMELTGISIGQALGAVSVTDFYRSVAGQLAGITLTSCTMPADYAVDRALSAIDAPAVTSNALTLYSVNNDPTKQERYTYGGQQTRDNAVFKRGPSSIRFDCWYAANPLTYSRTIQVAAGQTINVRGATRYNAAYDTATPPKVTLSGLGITPQVFTDPATGADVWHDYSLSATNPNAYPGEFTLTYQGQSAANSTGAYCYFDGVPDSPWIDSARHYGYLYDTGVAYQTADPSITISEATALAYPVTFNHATGALTLTGNATATQVYHAFKASLAATANQGYVPANTRIYTTDGGVTFGTSYDITIDTGCTLTGGFNTSGIVTLAGTGAVIGRYVDSSGAHVSIAAPALVSGSRVQLYNLTDGAELYNGVLSGTGIVLPTTWTADKTIRLRADHESKVALEVLGILSSIGLSILDTQVDDAAYTGAAIDGSTVTEFAADNVDIQAEVTDSDNVTTWQRLYAWWQWYQTTSAGIASPLFGRFRSSDGANFYLDRSGGLNITIRNNKTDPLRFTGGRLSTSDGSIPFDLTGGNIFPDYGPVYVPPSYATDTAAAVVAGLPAPLVLDNGEQLFTVKIVGGQPKYLSRG
jgi:hypothetical protein